MFGCDCNRLFVTFVHNTFFGWKACTEMVQKRRPKSKLTCVIVDWCAILIARHQSIVMAKHGGPCVHFSGISTCGRISRETVSHPQHPPLPTLCKIPGKISLPVYVIVTNEQLQPLTTTWYNLLVLYFSLLKIQRRLNKHRTFLRALIVDGGALS